LSARTFIFYAVTQSLISVPVLIEADKSLERIRPIKIIINQKF